MYVIINKLVEGVSLYLNSMVYIGYIQRIKVYIDV